MAKIGLKYPVFKNDNSCGVIGRGIKADIVIQSNSTELYSDDAVSETDNSFQNGTITMGIDDLSDNIQINFLGHVVDANGEITAAGEDVAPYNSIGFYGTKKVSGDKKYRAVWLKKVQFAEPNDSNQTKGSSTAFNTPEVVGKIMLDDSGSWKNEQTFDSESDAIAYLNGKAGIPVLASGGLTGLLITGTGGSLSPSFSSGNRYYVYTGLTGTSITVTATAANHKIQLYIDGALSQALTSGAASQAISISTGTKKLTIVAQEYGKKSQTTEIVIVK